MTNQDLPPNEVMEPTRYTARLMLCVCQAWHRAHGVDVPVPGMSGAAGAETGQGAIAR